MSCWQGVDLIVTGNVRKGLIVARLAARQPQTINLLPQEELKFLNRLIVGAVVYSKSCEQTLQNEKGVMATYMD
jgi:hypothetical protein